MDSRITFETNYLHFRNKRVLDNICTSTTCCSSPEKTPTARAQAQAAYRARNREAERDKARLRMRERREEEKARLEDQRTPLERDPSSSALRSSAVFARYRQHIKHHSIVIHGDPTDSDYVHGYERCNAKCWPRGGEDHPPNQIDREDAKFLLQRASAERRVSTPEPLEIDQYLDKLGRCRFLVGFDWDEGVPSQPLWYVRPAYDEYNDDNVEFMWRHAVPQPTIAAMDACGCSRPL
ncbi:hypothetical protein DFH06DRAFT_1347768 [Mycena polygramma]|nr:hypothetical protein DFH06DRAFT_1347768 [Mycena polygramma]